MLTAASPLRGSTSCTDMQRLLKTLHCLAAVKTTLGFLIVIVNLRRSSRWMIVSCRSILPEHEGRVEIMMVISMFALNIVSNSQVLSPGIFLMDQDSTTSKVRIGTPQNA